MKKLMLALCSVVTVIAALGVEADRSVTIGMLNGRAVQDLLVEKLQNGEDGAAALRYFEAVSWSSGERVFMRGYVSEVSKRLFVNAQNVVATVGRANGQPVNVKFHMRKDQSDLVAKLRPGQDIAVNGTLSPLPDLQSDLVLDDAVVVSAAEYEQGLADAKAAEDSVLGDCLVPAAPFATLPAGERTDLTAMARCAAAAYPNTAIPFGYRAMSREEWKRSTDRLGYADAVYSDDGFFVLGNGLRGRFMVHRLLNRAVVAWSGCDLLDGDFSRAGGPDFMACVKHCLLGETALQFSQAADITAGVLNAFDGEVWAVGHSLGGCLVTYAALRIEDSAGRLKGATFNGLGLSSTVARSIPVAERDAGARRITNVYGTGDPLYGGHQLLAWTKLAPRRFGRAYYVVTPPAPVAEDGTKETVEHELMRTHGIDLLADLLADEAPPVSGLTLSVCGAGLLIAVLLGTVIFLFARKRL